MKKFIHINGPDGVLFKAYESRPAGDGPFPAIIVIQEIFGVNEGMRDICDGFARMGYVALCPDLFWRQEPGIELTDKTEAEWQKAFALFNGFDVDLGIEDLKTTLAHARADKTCTGMVGSVGFCLGGKLAYLMATRSDADCNVSYYGVGIQDMLGEADDISHPLLMHIAGLDKFVPPAAQAAIHKELDSHKMVTLHDYPDSDHAFARPNGQHHDPAAAKEAEARTAAFFKEHLTPLI